MMSVRILALLCVIALSAPVVSAQSPDWALVHMRTMEAIDRLYNLDFVGAERKCNEVIGLAPRDPRGHFFKSMTYYYRMVYRGGSKNDSAFWAFAYHADKVKKVCEDILDRNDKDSKAKFYLGGTIGFKGLAYVGRGEMMKALWDGKKGYDLLEEAVEEDPSNNDAKMGLGMFQYMIDQAPEAVKPAVKLAGLTGDRWGGIKLLEQAAANGLYAKAEARRWLTIFYGDEDMPQRSAAHMKWLHESYPENWYFALTYADITCWQLKKVGEAERSYVALLSMNTSSSDRSYVQWIASIRLGNVHVAREQYKQALQHYEHAYENASSDARKRESAARIATVYDMMDQHVNAAPWYAKAGEAAAKERAARGLSDRERIRDKVAWAYSVGRYDRVIELADSVRSGASGPMTSADAGMVYQSGVALSELKRYSDAADRFNAVLSLRPTEPSLIGYTHYQLGVAMARQDKTAVAREHLEKALEGDPDDKLRKKVLREKSRLR